MRMGLKELDLACLTGLLALAVGGGFVAARSIDALARQVERRNRASEERMAELNQARTVLNALDRALLSNQSALAALHTRLPESHDMGQFISGLDRTANRNNVELRTVQPGDPVREELCSRTPVRFACRGAFANLHALVYQLETMERLVRIDDLHISGGTPREPRNMDVSCSVFGK